MLARTAQPNSRRLACHSSHRKPGPALPARTPGQAGARGADRRRRDRARPCCRGMTTPPRRQRPPSRAPVSTSATTAGPRRVLADSCSRARRRVSATTAAGRRAATAFDTRAPSRPLKPAPATTVAPRRAPAACRLRALRQRRPQAFASMADLRKDRAGWAGSRLQEWPRLSRDARSSETRGRQRVAPSPLVEAIATRRPQSGDPT